MAIVVLEHNCRGLPRLLNLVDQRAEGSNALEALQNIALILQPRMANALDDNELVLNITEGKMDQLSVDHTWQEHNPTENGWMTRQRLTDLARQTVSYICLVMVYTPSLPRRHCPILRAAVAISMMEKPRRAAGQVEKLGRSQSKQANETRHSGVRGPCSAVLCTVCTVPVCLGEVRRSPLDLAE